MTFPPRGLPSLVLPFLTVQLAVAQALPRTTAERTAYQATSTDADVGAFLDSLALAGAPIAISEMGTSTLGHPIYLVIASDPAITTPGQAAAAGKLVVYIQANIHAGEVEGKEAVQALLREIAGPRRALLQRLVVLVAPNYNPDGNDAFGPQAVNRSEQNGPEQVGQRADGMNLDLNRDYFKAEAPETRGSLARVITTWDPALMMDLHTTDGTRHGYLLTYAPPLDPIGPAGPTAYVRDQMLPALRKTLQDRYHEPIFDYGNVDDPLAPKSWDTYAPVGWYGINYMGLRGRMAILSEAYSHADFKTRVQVTHDFVAEVLDYAAQHGEDIRRIERDADRQTTLEGAGQVPRPTLAIAYKLAGRGVEPVSLEVVKPRGDTSKNAPPLPTGTLRTVQLPVNDRFVDSVTRPLPAGYILPAASQDVVQLLLRHGIAVQRLEAASFDTVETFEASDLTWAAREFQGHHLLTVTATTARSPRTAPAGAYFVSTAQPLGRLVFALLEPEGYGLARWGMFDRLLGSATGAYSGLVYGSVPARELAVWRALRVPRVGLRLIY
ncbi:MAG TPA: M14 family zinc carboxypeptidase [Gemmatimonadales bacterium]|nr:M14 family zinc carboxypeptidase [Gemmatimonadales bacterium]